MDNKALAPLAGVLVVALVVAAPVVTVAASQAAIPGEALYGLKRATEGITAPSALLKLDRRVGELVTLADKNPDPNLIDLSAGDIVSTVDAVVAQAHSVDGIDRAIQALGEAASQLTTLMGRSDMPDAFYAAIETAMIAIANGQIGLAIAMGELNDLSTDGSVLDVVP